LAIDLKPVAIDGFELQANCYKPKANGILINQNLGFPAVIDGQ